MGLKKIAGKILAVGGKIIAGKKGEKATINTENLEGLSKLSPRAQVWRSITRPLITFSIIGVIVLGILIQYVQGIIGVEETIEIPKQLFTFGKLVMAFWFGSRGLEKIINKII